MIQNARGRQGWRRRWATGARSGAAGFAVLLVVVLSGCSSGAVTTIAAATVQLDSAVQSASLAVEQAADGRTFAPVAATTLENAITEVGDASTKLSGTAVAAGREEDAKHEVTVVLEDAAAALDAARTALQGGGELDKAAQSLAQIAARTAELRHQWEPSS